MDVHPPEEYAYLSPLFVIVGARVFIVCVYNIHNFIKNWMTIKAGCLVKIVNNLHYLEPPINRWLFFNKVF